MRTITWVLALVTIFLFVGCDDHNPVDPGTIPSGTLSGEVILYQEQDNAGVTIAVEGTRFSTQSERNGSWSISGLPAGQYTITFAKNLYGTFKSVNYNYVVGGPQNLNVVLYKIPAYEVTGLSASMVGNEVVLKGNLIGNVPINAPMRVFVSASPTISSNQYVFSCRIVASNITTGTVLSFRESEGLSVTDFLANGIGSGQDAYIVAYGEGESANSYVDPGTGATVYPVLSSYPSNVASVLVP